MTDEQLLLLHAQRIAFAAAAAADAKPKPIVIPEAPWQPELPPEYDGARVLH
jgi:hypothetical protein